MKTTLEKPAVPRRLFVLPQHLEVRDRYHEALLDESLSALAPHAWGIARLTIDTEALNGGMLRVTELLGRFQSGEIAELTPKASPLELSVSAQSLADGPHDVWVGLADWSGDGPNAAIEPGAATRYRRINSPLTEGRPTLRPRLRLYVEGLERLPTDRIRVARIHGAGEGINLDPDLLPPMLWPLGGTFLPGALSGVIGALQVRQSQLLAARRDRPHEPLTFPAEQVPQLIALSVISQALAALTSPTSERGVPPWELHRILSELLGAIDAMEGRLRSLPTYDHESCGPAFRILADRLLESIPAFALPPHEAFPFTRRDLHTFELKLPAVAALRRPLYLVLSGADRSALEHGVPTHAKLASDGWMERIRQTATRGIDLSPVFEPPASLPSSNHSACFRLNTRSEHWADVLERRTLILYLPNAGASLEATFYVMRTNDVGLPT